MKELVILNAMARAGAPDHESLDLINDCYEKIKDVVEPLEWLRKMTFYGKTVTTGDKIFELKFDNFHKSEHGVYMMFSIVGEFGSKVNYDFEEYGTLFAVSKEEL